MGNRGYLRCSKLCTPLRGERQATQCVDAVAKNAKALIIVLLATKSWTYTNIMGGGENEKE